MATGKSPFPIPGAGSEKGCVHFVICLIPQQEKGFITGPAREETFLFIREEGVSREFFCNIGCGDIVHAAADNKILVAMFDQNNIGDLG